MRGSESDGRGVGPLHEIWCVGKPARAGRGATTGKKPLQPPDKRWGVGTLDQRRPAILLHRGDGAPSSSSIQVGCKTRGRDRLGLAGVTVVFSGGPGADGQCWTMLEAARYIPPLDSVAAAGGAGLVAGGGGAGSEKRSESFGKYLKGQ